MKYGAFVVVLLLAVCAVFYYLAIGGGVRPENNNNDIDIEYRPSQTQTAPKAIAPSECTGGAKKICVTADGCDGEMLCIGGKWSDCNVRSVCRPGRVAPCPLDSCSFGLRTCNACGDSWSPCTDPR